MSWLGQIQWVKRFETLATELITSGDLQLSSSRLLGLEKFTLGGHASIRGYRENELVRDNGLTASLELRIPVNHDWLGKQSLKGVCFVDWGIGWDNGGGAANQTLWSLGVGLWWRFFRDSHLELHWAKALVSIAEGGGSDLQDKGLQFSISTVF